MKNIAVLSGDKRQIYANSYLNNNGFCSYIKNNFDFNEDAYILCGTPFFKDSLYLNCDLYSSFPISTFIALLKPGQTVFAGNISNDVTTSLKKKNINYFDFLKDEKVVWSNAMLTAEGLISNIINNTPFALDTAKALIIGFGRCGINTALKLKALNVCVTIYDHTPIHLCQASSYGLNTSTFDNLIECISDFDIIINTVPCEVLTENLLSLVKKDCVLFEVASKPYGINNELVKKYRLSLVTCLGLPGKTAPKSAGELIAKSIISYLERTGENGTQL